MKVITVFWSDNTASVFAYETETALRRAINEVSDSFKIVEQSRRDGDVMHVGSDCFVYLD